MFRWVGNNGIRTFSLYSRHNEEITAFAGFMANWAPSPQVHNYHSIKCGFETPFQFHAYSQKSVFVVQREVPSIEQRNGRGKSQSVGGSVIILCSCWTIAKSRVPSIAPRFCCCCHFPFICSCEIALLRYDYRFAATAAAQNTLQSECKLFLLLHLLLVNI